MAAVGEAPPFWWERPDWRARALWPFSSVYGFVASTRMVTARREQVPAAVLCVGNLTVGGEGKTPIAIALAREAKRMRVRAGFLSRGYGGALTEPHLVDAEKDAARLVGDEPLLLARHAPTVVAPDRIAGARRLIEEGCELVIMDDGFQSARLHMDYALIVVDAKRGLGNGHVIPGGPLRAPLTHQMRFANAVVTVGEGSAADTVVRPVHAARIRPLRASGLKGTRVLAFAGIGNPQKFFDTLREIGAEIVSARAFPDHHPYSDEDILELRAEAVSGSLQLVTTEKDLVRLRSGHGIAADFLKSVRALPVEAVFEVRDTPAAIVGETLTRWRERRLKTLA
jgi:tetraacyldisaccharide 4'-kinase